MQVIFGRDTAEQVRERYTVLELETFHANGQAIPAFCVVPSDKIPLEDIRQVENLKDLHQQFINSFNTKDYDAVKTLYKQLHGRWTGELDSFYDAILNKISSSST
jgi:hypothetical protein